MRRVAWWTAWLIVVHVTACAEERSQPRPPLRPSRQATRARARRRRQSWQRLARVSWAPPATANRASAAFSPAGPRAGRRWSGNWRWAPATACRRSAAAGCFNSIALADRARLRCLDSGDRQAAVDVRISERLRGPVRLRQRPALLAGGRRRPRLHLRRRRDAALPERGRRQADLEGRHGGRIRRDSELLRRRQHAGRSRAIC